MEGTLERWRSEKTAAYLSSAVARAERDPNKAALFRKMSEAAEEQAGILAKDLGEVPGLPALAPVALHRFSHRSLRRPRHAPRALRREGPRRLGLSRQG